MPSEEERSEPAWGTSFELFGSDSSNGLPSEGRYAPETVQARSRAGRKSSERTSFGGSSTGKGRATGLSGGTIRARSGGRGRGSRPSYDDPFGPVFGSSAEPSDATDTGRPGSSAGRKAGKSRSGGRQGARKREAADGAAGTGSKSSPAGSAGDGTGGIRAEVVDPAGGATAAERTVEEWSSQARSVVLRQLALGPRSRHQLSMKLSEREIPDAVAEALLDRFEEVQLIDDAEFARLWVRTRVAVKALSRTSIRRELSDKGVDPELAEDALQQISDDEELGRAREIVHRKLRSGIDLTDRSVRDREIRRLVGVLARKGYGTGAAFSIVKGIVAGAQTDADAVLGP